MPEVFARDPQARALMEQHVAHCNEREARHTRDHVDLVARSDALSQKLSEGIQRLHSRLDEADVKRNDLVTAFSKEIANLTVANASNTTRQNIIWSLVVAAMGIVGAVITALLVRGLI